MIGRYRRSATCRSSPPAARATARVAAPVVDDERGARLALRNLHSASDRNPIVGSTVFAACAASDPGFIDVDVLSGPAVASVLIRTNYPRSELVEDLKRRLLALQVKLSLKLLGRHAGCLAGHRIGSPKPDARRQVSARHDRSHRQSGVTAALAAAQDAGAIRKTEHGMIPSRKVESFNRALSMGMPPPDAIDWQLVLVQFRDRLTQSQALISNQFYSLPKFAAVHTLSVDRRPQYRLRIYAVRCVLLLTGHPGLSVVTATIFGLVFNIFSTGRMVFAYRGVSVSGITELRVQSIVLAAIRRRLLFYFLNSQVLEQR